MTDSYGALAAEFYDLTHPVGAGYADVSVYTGLAGKAPGKVLDVGCGNGRVLVPMLRAGIDAEGLEPSRAMLTTALRYLTQDDLEAPVHHKGVEELPADGAYAAVVMARSTLALLGEERDVVQGLARVRGALMDSGMLYFDVRVLDAAPRRAQARRDRFEAATWDGYRIVREDASSIHPAERLERTQLHYTKTSPDGEVVATERTSFARRLFVRGELTKLFERAGFEAPRQVEVLDGPRPGSTNEQVVLWSARAAVRHSVETS